VGDPGARSRRDPEGADKSKAVVAPLLVAAATSLAIAPRKLTSSSEIDVTELPRMVGPSKRCMAFKRSRVRRPSAPLWGRAEGRARINVHTADGTLVRSFDAIVPVNYTTTIYTYGEDEPTTFRAAEGFATRDVVEQAAATFCGR
jgi:hypothetical protein